MDRAAGTPPESATRYGSGFFSAIAPSSHAGAEHLLPLVFELVEPRSVADLGCGSGAWLVEAARLGVQDYLGIDGYTPAESLRLDDDHFVQHDLTTPLRLDRTFDLVLCLEVAEHLEPDRADVLVDSLVRLAPTILFSAAVPHQSGEHHVNEQWPEYWVERFAGHGLVPVDAVRPQIWSEPAVPWWYRQNTLLFCAPDAIEQRPALGLARKATRARQLAVVHPELHSWMAHQRDSLAAELRRGPSLRELLSMLPRAAAAAFRRRLRSSDDTTDGPGTEP